MELSSAENAPTLLRSKNPSKMKSIRYFLFVLPLLFILLIPPLTFYLRLRVATPLVNALRLKENTAFFRECAEKAQKCVVTSRDGACVEQYGSDEVLIDPRLSSRFAHTVTNFTTVYFDLSNYTNIADLRCTNSPFPGAYYHAMIDCFPTYLPLFLGPELRGDDVLWLVEEQHVSLLEQLRFIHEKNVMPIPKGTLVNISARQVWFPMSSSSPDLLRACIPMFRLKVFETFHLPTLNFCESRSLLYIGRSEDRGRTVIGRERLLSHLAEAFPLLEIVYFWGNETMYEMAQMFSRAKIVIAPHGAGIVNCIFCQNDAFLIEITRTDRESGKLWRTNTGVLRWTGIQSYIYLMPREKIVSRLDINEAGASLSYGEDKALPFPLADDDILDIVVKAANFSSNCWLK